MPYRAWRSVTPAQAGVHRFVDSHFLGNDGFRRFLNFELRVSIFEF